MYRSFLNVLMMIWSIKLNNANKLQKILPTKTTTKKDKHNLLT